jgi:L-asparaginase II
MEVFRSCSTYSVQFIRFNGLGIAVKVEDGNVSVLYAVVAELLAELDLGTSGQRAALDAFHARPIVNTMGVEVGNMAFSVALESHRHGEA